MLSALKELLYPDRCIGCGAWGVALCDRCISKLEGFKFYRNSYAFGFYEGVLQDLVCFAKYKGYGEPLKGLRFRL